MSAYDELSPRARWFMENFDECGVAEICATHEAAAAKAEAAIARIRALVEENAVAIDTSYIEGALAEP